MVNDREISSLDLAFSEENCRILSLSVKQSPASIVITDIYGNIEYVNPKFTTITGYTLNEVKGKNPRILSSGETSKEEYNELWKTILSGNEWRGEFHNKKKNGGLFWEYAIISPIKNSDGQITHFLGVKEDITEKKLIFSELEESEYKYRELMENSIDGIVITDDNANLTLVNAEGSRMLGYTMEELLKMNIKDTYPDFERDAFEANLMKVRNNGIHSYERRMKRKDGSIFFAELRVRKIKDNGFQAIIRDITDRKKSEEKIQLTANILNHVGQAVIATDIKGRVVYFNNIAEKLYEWEQEEALGKDIQNICFFPFSEERTSNMMETVRCGGVWRGEIVIQKKDLSFFTVFLTVNPVYDSDRKCIGIVFISFDLTEQKRKENELLEAKKKAEEMNKLKTTFLTNVSHELRTPMVGILGFAEILLAEIKENSQKEMVKDVFVSGKRLLNTLDLIINFSKIESNQVKIKYSTFKLDDLIRETVSLFKSAANLKNISLNFSSPEDNLNIYSDENIIYNILTNLLHNAIKFTKEGFITIDLYLEEVSNAEYAVRSVSDTGIGISIDEQKIIFDEFRQADEGINRPFEGTGLGLTLTKKYIELLNGFISLKSVPGMGSKFYVYLPMKKSGLIESNDCSDDQPPQIKLNNSGLPKILLVENDSVTISLTKIHLKDVCELDIAKNVQSALFLVEKNSYDLILMDINLGDIVDGFYLTQILRNNSKYKETPIIAFTAYAMSSNKENFISAGCSDCILKPFTKSELHHIIKANLPNSFKEIL